MTDLGGPLDALSFSPDYKSLAVGGREVFKILSFENNVFQERLNLKRGRHNVLNKTIVDIKWHYKRQNTLATAPTSGNVIIWDLLDSQGTMIKVYAEHSRTVNKLSWKPNDESLILSASQDGLVKLWDIRNDKSSSTFEIKSEVRQVKWSPFYQNLFATGTENGSVDIWDVRKPEAPFRAVRSAHIGVIHALDWHPKLANTIASGSRDLMIKIFDLSQPEDIPKVSIQTIAVVSCISWRPGFQTQLVSGSNVMDYDAHIWDIQQPYIPKYSIEFHQDVITDMQWYKNDGDFLLSCSKDSTIKLHKVTEAKTPYDNCQSTSLSWNPRDQLIFTPSIDKNEKQEKKTVQPNSSKKCTIDIQNKHGEIQILEENELSQVKSIRHFAKNLKVFGDDSIEEKCLYNAKIASDIGEEEVKLAWLLLASLDLSDLVETQVETTTTIDPSSPRSTDSPLNYNTTQERQTPQTFEFGSLNFDSPNLVQVLDGILEVFSESCNVQMAFCVSWIFQKKSKFAQERFPIWQHEYLQILSRMREFVCAAEIRKYTFVSTKHLTLNVCCGSCGKMLVGGKCQNCNIEAHICVICRLPCKGSYLWLSKCGHGGHIDHLKQWFRSKPYCPACSLPLNKCFV